jgi:hypothetical protein
MSTALALESNGKGDKVLKHLHIIEASLKKALKEDRFKPQELSLVHLICHEYDIS